MSALNFAKHAFSREKPHSSTTDWVEILTSSNIEEEAYDGIPELVDSINLQASGPAEASRALRKKIKHGNAHQQYRALVLLKALVENCGPKFIATFQDSHFVDALKMVASDPLVDRRVRKKLTLVLASWRDQFKDDPSMASIAGLYKQMRLDVDRTAERERDLSLLMGVPTQEEIRRREKREERKRKEADPGRKGRDRSKRQPFDFEKEKPRVLGSIVEASQASSNLVNAVTLVNPENDIYANNERVQDCLDKAKLAKKAIVRYIQLVENEELIGTLIEANDRINSAIETYEQLSAAQADALAEKLNGTRLDDDKREPQDVNPQYSDHGLSNAQGKSKAAEKYVHPDLEDLSFGALGSSSNHLPPPLRPSSLPNNKQPTFKDHELFDNARGSLSEYSDYESSDEDTHQASSSRRAYVHVSDDDEDYYAANKAAPLTSHPDDDPFADPFADEAGTAPRK